MSNLATTTTGFFCVNVICSALYPVTEGAVASLFFSLYLVSAGITAFFLGRLAKIEADFIEVDDED